MPEEQGQQGQEEAKVKKVQFNFSEKALNAFDALKDRVEAPSRAETLRYAIRLLQWISDETHKGNRLCLETREGIQKVIIPFLGHGSSGISDSDNTVKEP